MTSAEHRRKLISPLTTEPDPKGHPVTTNPPTSYATWTGATATETVMLKAEQLSPHGLIRFTATIAPFIGKTITAERSVAPMGASLRGDRLSLFADQSGNGDIYLAARTGQFVRGELPIDAAIELHYGREMVPLTVAEYVGWEPDTPIDAAPEDIHNPEVPGLVVSLNPGDGAYLEAMAAISTQTVGQLVGSILTDWITTHRATLLATIPDERF